MTRDRKLDGRLSSRWIDRGMAHVDHVTAAGHDVRLRPLRMPRSRVPRARGADTSAATRRPKHDRPVIDGAQVARAHRPRRRAQRRSQAIIAVHSTVRSSPRFAAMAAAAGAPDRRRHQRRRLASRHAGGDGRSADDVVNARRFRPSRRGAGHRQRRGRRSPRLMGHRRRRAEGWCQPARRLDTR
jgi:hypothetical protein